MGILEKMTGKKPYNFTRFLDSPTPKNPTWGFYVPRQTALTGMISERQIVGICTRFARKGMPIGIYR